MKKVILAIIVIALAILAFGLLKLSQCKDPEDFKARIFNTGVYTRHPKPVIKPYSNSINLYNLRAVEEILDRYDRLYQKDDDFCRLANSIMDSLGIDGRSLYSIISFRESGSNPWAIGDMHLKHHAYGSFQMRQPALTDIKSKGFNKALHLRDFLGDGDEALINSVEAFHKYIAIYLEANETRNLNAWLNTWNAGPKGTSKDSKYTNKARRLLANFSH